MLIIQRPEEEKPKTHQSYPSSQLKEEDVAASHFSSEGKQIAMEPKIEEEVGN